MQWLSLPLISEMTQTKSARNMTLIPVTVNTYSKFTSAAFSVRCCNMASFLMNVF